MTYIRNEMLRYQKNRETCDHRLKSDFSFFESGATERTPFFYCIQCATHWFKGKEWNPDEWEEYVNG